MNKSDFIFELLNNLSQSQIVYDEKKGLKLLRFGDASSRFAQQEKTYRYHKPPTSRGTYASISPFSPYVAFPGANDGHRHLDVRNQSKSAHVAYQNAEDNFLLKPVTFFWKHEIYSHVDKNGEYKNNSWIWYKSAKELYTVVQNSYKTLMQSVDRVKASSQNSGNSKGALYFDNNEFEVFIPHEQP